jgi:hypothetical protein
MASCVVPGAPPYVDVYSIEFSSSGPVLKTYYVGGNVVRYKAIHVVSMLQSGDMWSSPGPRISDIYDLTSSSQELFDGLLARLARYHFFDMNDVDSQETAEDSSEYTITAARCGTKHTVHLTLPTNATTLDNNTQAMINLFNDLLHATLLSKWLHTTTFTTGR